MEGDSRIDRWWASVLCISSLHRFRQAPLAVRPDRLRHRAPQLAVGHNPFALLAGSGRTIDGDLRGAGQLHDRARDLRPQGVAQDHTGHGAAEVEPGGEGEGDHLVLFPLRPRSRYHRD